MKRIFIILATMLQISMVAYAQNGNSDPLRGDVNGDGKVDLADVTELVNIILSNSTAPATTYYWYVGTIQPTDPTNSAQNTGLNAWTSLGTTLPTSSIQVAKSDPAYADHTWYIAAPNAANFTLYNAQNGMSVETAWTKSTIDIGTVQYTLWTSKAQSDQAVNYLHK